MASPDSPPGTALGIELPLPPPAIRFMAESDEQFVAIGDEALEDLREMAGLGDTERVLDIGCGYGRLAHALLRDARFTGTYLGIDILERPIEWCRDQLVAPSGGRFEFRTIDVANARYNPSGATAGHMASLDVEPESFDVAVLLSVFTHLDPATVERYLEECSTALDPGGRVFISAFLLDESWRRCEEAGASPIEFRHRLTEFCRYQHAEDPLHAIAYDPGWLIARAEEADLVPTAPPRLGSWCGREGGQGHLDVLVLRRTGPEGGMSKPA